MEARGGRRIVDGSRAAGQDAFPPRPRALPLPLGPMMARRSPRRTAPDTPDRMTRLRPARRQPRQRPSRRPKLRTAMAVRLENWMTDTERSALSGGLSKALSSKGSVGAAAGLR